MSHSPEADPSLTRKLVTAGVLTLASLGVGHGAAAQEAPPATAVTTTAPAEIGEPLIVENPDPVTTTAPAEIDEPVVITNPNPSEVEPTVTEAPTSTTATPAETVPSTLATTTTIEDETDIGVAVSITNTTLSPTTATPAENLQQPADSDEQLATTGSSDHLPLEGVIGAGLVTGGIIALAKQRQYQRRQP